MGGCHDNYETLFEEACVRFRIDLENGVAMPDRIPVWAESPASSPSSGFDFLRQYQRTIRPGEEVPGVRRRPLGDFLEKGYCIWDRYWLQS